MLRIIVLSMIIAPVEIPLTLWLVYQISKVDQEWHDEVKKALGLK